MEVLSDVLRAVRLTGAMFFDVEAKAPWVAHTPPAEQIAGRIMPDAQHVMGFHAVLEGSCWAELPDDDGLPAVRLAEGDVIVLPTGARHLTASSPGLYVEPNLARYHRPADHPLPFVLHKDGGGTECARLACGYLGCDARPFNPLLDALPAVIHARGQAAAVGLVRRLIQAALDESRAKRAGSEIVLARLSELLFVEVLRAHLDALPEEARGWFAGLRDRHVGAALRLMHARPAAPWTIEGLAREVGLSRSVFAERFAHYLGVGPIQYLTRWRLQLAALLLERPGVGIARVAQEVGYESEPAFNRAFKKLTGSPPAAWRRSRAA
jgi:AraC-like DNA-binding protein